MANKTPSILPKTQGILTELGENIRLARLRRKLSSEQVAERAGMGRSTLVKIEQGNPGVGIGHYLPAILMGSLEQAILTSKGWKLSPAYDINPVETGTGLSLNISQSDNSMNLELARDVCKFFRLSENRAHKIIANVTDAVRNWKNVAKKYGISNSEQELKSKAFYRAEL